MRKAFFYSICISVIIIGNQLFAQRSDSMSVKKWEHNVSVYSYFFKDPYIFLPTYMVDRDKLHLEARYNYEDLEAFSAWIGYNIKGGEKLKYTITPMAGGVVGSTEAVAAGLKFEFVYKQFSVASESEYLFDVHSREDDFFYNWTDATYTPATYFNAGISIQRTRLFHSNLELQKGLFVGTSFKRFQFSSYFFNFFIDDPYIVVKASVDF